MSKSKYKKGKMIKSMSDFAKSDKTWFKVSFGDRLKTTHKSFLISWQYRTLELFINRGAIYEADKNPDCVTEVQVKNDGIGWSDKTRRGSEQ